MPKKKKVSKISYETKMSKRKGKVRWLVIERPTGSIIAEEVFEDQPSGTCDDPEFKFKGENIKDTLMDMAIYSLITMILYEEEEETNDKNS